MIFMFLPQFEGNIIELTKNTFFCIVGDGGSKIIKGAGKGVGQIVGGGNTIIFITFCN